MNSRPLDYGWWPHTISPRIASYRIRCHNIMQRLNREGLNCGIWQPGMPAPRVLILFKRYDRKTLDTALALRDTSGCAILLDICDNHFHADIKNNAFDLRELELRRAALAADLIVASTDYLAEQIRHNTGSRKHIVVIGDALDTPQSQRKKALRGVRARWQLAKLQQRLETTKVPKGRRLVWFGNHGSPNVAGGLSDLATIGDSLTRAHNVSPLHLTVISNNHRKYNQTFKNWTLPTSYLEWDPGTFSNALSLHDTCVIPIGGNPFTLSKTNNRPATALLHGLRVIADPIPSYLELAQFISLGNWDRSLELELRSRDEPDLRLTHAAAWLKKNYGIESISNRWLGTLREAAKRSEQKPCPPGYR